MTDAEVRRAGACLLGLALSAAAAGPALAIDGPARATGDGRTPVVLAVQVQPPADGTPVVEVEAGELLDVRQAGPGAYECRFLPPRVAAPADVRVKASVAAGKVSASFTLRVEPPPPDAASVASGGPLDLRAPAQMVLGRSPSVELSLRPPDGAEVGLQVNVGEVSALRPAGDRLVATYTPPKQLYPQVLIVAVTNDRGALLDWLPVPLAGLPRIDTQTEPDTSVRVRVEGEEFGPQRTDRAGKARVAIVVPPGVTSAVTVVRDRVGNVKEGSVAIEAPPFDRLLALCPRTGDRLVVLAVDSRGRRSERERLQVQASRGKLGAPSLIAPGVYEAPFTLPEDFRLGEDITLTARVAGKQGGGASACHLTITGAPPAQLRTSLEPATYRAGSGAPVAVTVEMLDTQGKAAQGADPVMRVDFGALSPLRAAGPGRYRATWKLPDRFDSRTAAKLDARAGADGHITSEAPLTLSPSGTANLSLAAEQRELDSSAGGSTRLRARAVDAYGNPVPAAPLRAAARGQVGALAPGQEAGSYQTVYSVPADRTRMTDRVVVRDEATGAEVSLDIRVSPRIATLMFGLKVGYASNLGRIASPLIGADAAIRLPVSWLLLGVEGAFTRSTAVQKDASGTEDIFSSVTFAPLLGRLSLRGEVNGWGLYLGAGAGASVVSWELSSESTGRVVLGGAFPAFSAHAGADRRLGPGRVAVEALAVYARSRGADLPEDVAGVLLSGGYRLEF